MSKILKDEGFAFLSIVFALLIIALLYFAVMKLYFESGTKKLQNVPGVAEQGIDTSSYQTMVKSAKTKVNEFNKQIEKNDEKMKKLLENSGQQ